MVGRMVRKGLNFRGLGDSKREELDYTIERLYFHERGRLWR